METKERVLICFYDSNFTPYLRRDKFNKKYDVVGLFSPLGWGLSGKDASYTDGGSNLNMTVENKFEEYLNECDTVIFAKPDNYIDCKESVYPKIFAAIENKKNIICLLNVEEKSDEIKEKCIQKSVYFKNYYNISPLIDLYIDDNFEKYIFEINIPIISVFGIADNTCKFNVEAELKDMLENSGYKTVLIGSKDYCEFLNEKSFPNFMFDSKLSEKDKIFYFNSYIKSIEINEKPDVIIIGVPGGIMPFSNTVTNNFGITAFEVFQAIRPDFSVLCIFNENFKSGYFKLLSNNIRFRYGFEIDAFSISNRQIDWVEMDNGRPGDVKYISLDLKYIKDRIDEYRKLSNKPIYDIFDLEDSKKLFDNLINKLEENESASMV